MEHKYNATQNKLERTQIHFNTGQSLNQLPLGHRTLHVLVHECTWPCSLTETVYCTQCSVSGRNTIERHCSPAIFCTKVTIWQLPTHFVYNYIYIYIISLCTTPRHHMHLVYHCISLCTTPRHHMHLVYHCIALCTTPRHHMILRNANHAMCTQIISGTIR